MKGVDAARVVDGTVYAYVRGDGPTLPEIITRADHKGFAVQDVGIGIKPASLTKIFDTFYSTKPQGMGMGLAIARSIIENHGGRLWALPNDGPGMTFQFALPVKPVGP